MEYLFPPSASQPRSARQPTADRESTWPPRPPRPPPARTDGHRSRWLNAVLVGWGFGLAESDRYLHTLPIFHVNGWGLPLANAALGVPNVIQRDVRGPEILRRVEREGITLLCGAAPVACARCGSEPLTFEVAA